MELALKPTKTGATRVEPGDLDTVLSAYTEIVRLALRPRIKWERDICLFFAKVQKLHSLQSTLLHALLLDWWNQSGEDAQDVDAWKQHLEQQYDLALPEQAKAYLPNPYRVSLLLACMKTFQERCLEELLWLISLLRPDQTCSADTLLQEVFTSEAELAELILMCEDLYAAFVPDHYLLPGDTLATVVKKITCLVFSQCKYEL